MSGKVDSESSGTTAKAPLGSILILEDNALLAMALEDALLVGGADEVVIFARADLALDYLKENRPDVLILDAHVADSTDGWAMAELAPLLGPRPPQIVFSTGAPQDIPANIAELGLVFEKPYDPAQLVDALHVSQHKGLFGRFRKAIR